MSLDRPGWPGLSSCFDNLTGSGRATVPQRLVSGRMLLGEVL